MTGPAAGGEGAEGAARLAQALELLRRALLGQDQPAPLPETLADQPELPALLADIRALHDFTLALSRGELEAQLTTRGTLAGALKGLQASLRHLTWQAGAIAAGDYSQRVDFLGAFSAAFNSMVEQLGRTVAELSESRAELLEKNRQLEKEIDQRNRLAETLRLSRQRYLELAAHDELTGLFNRRQFYFLAERELHKQRRHGRPLGLLMLDIDHFKRVNDTFGHAAGDEVLRSVAEIIRGALRVGDTAARYGGEELVLLLADTGEEGAMQAAERLRQDIALWSTPTAKGTVRVTVSIGAAVITPGPDAGQEVRPRLEAAIRLADEALYRAKGEGRDRCALHAGELPPQT